MVGDRPHRAIRGRVERNFVMDVGDRGRNPWHYEYVKARGVCGHWTLDPCERGVSGGGVRALTGLDDASTAVASPPVGDDRGGHRIVHRLGSCAKLTETGFGLKCWL
jgi:hypothetical protein